MERLKNPWCNRRHFAVATFLHRGVFKSAQRREWHVDADAKTLRHMTRGRVLRVDAELHDGQRLQVFNVHEATSGDMQLQQHTYAFSKNNGSPTEKAHRDAEINCTQLRLTYPPRWRGY